MKQLISAGANVNAVEPVKGQTALMWAAAEGHSDVVQALIAGGADVQAKSKAGFNALVFAAIKNDAKSAESLIAAGVDPNFALPDGSKVLSIAAVNKSSAAAGGAGGSWRRSQYHRSWRHDSAAYSGTARQCRPGE